MSRRSSRFLLCAATVLAASPALAEDTDDIQSLLSESVITTASTSAQKASTAPATSMTLTAEDLRVYGIRSLDEAINFLSLGVITSDPLRTPDIGARGVLLPGDNGKHFLLLVNGHGMNDPLYGAARFDQGAGFPIDMVDHIEVIVGPGSVLYGSNAMLGVINVITKNASDYRGGHAYGEYEFDRSYHAGVGTGFTFKLLGQPSEITANVDYFSRFGPDLDMDPIRTERNLGSGQFLTFRRGGPADGVWGGKLRDAYFTEAPSGMLRFRTGDFEVNVMASAYRRGLPYLDGSTNVDFDDKASFELDRAVRLDIRHQATLSSLVQLTSRLYGDSFDYQRRVNRNAEAGCYQSHFATCQYYDAGLSRWTGIEERFSLNWLEDLSFVTLLGVDARLRWVGAKEEALNFDTGQPFAPTTGKIHDSAGIISPYIQQTWSPTRFLDLNGGARLDADQRFSPIVSPRGAIAVSPFRKTTFKAIYSQAFRAPTWTETDAGNYQQARSANVTPEIARSLEGTIEQRFGTHRILFGVFRTWWSNFIEPRSISPTERTVLQEQGALPITANTIVQYRNVSSIENYGWNGGWSGALAESHFNYGVNATAAFTRRISDRGEQQLEVAPQFFGNAHVSYAFGGFIPTPALAASYVGQRPAARAFDGVFAPVPYANPLAEFRATLSGRLPALTGLSYRISAAYATASRGAYTVGPGVSAATSAPQPAELVPIDQFRVFFGLRYDFLTGAEASTSGEQP
jgi:outer membrane receptor for ferrienterochelin and colicins